MSFDLNSVYTQLGSSVQNLETDLSNFAQTMNPNSQTDMIKLQQMMQKWTIATEMQSNTLKTISEGIKSTVGNIR